MRTAVARLAIVVAAVFTAVGGAAIARAAVPDQATSTAVVIVDTGSGVHQSVIHFDGTTTGLGALQLAGANPETINYGGPLGQAVCKLYGVGDEPVPSQCPGGWVYYRAVGGANGWSQSSAGASNTTVHDGDVEGWKYGGGQPPFSSYCSVVGCAPPPTAAPPATAAPPVSSGGGPSADTVAPRAPSANTGTTPPGDRSAAPKDPTVEGATATRETTTTTGKRGETTGAHRAHRDGSDDVQVAAGGSGGGDDGGSPVGVILAVAIVAVGVVGGLWLRRRRRGPAPS